MIIIDSYNYDKEVDFLPTESVAVPLIIKFLNRARSWNKSKDLQILLIIIYSTFGQIIINFTLLMTIGVVAFLL